MSRSPRFVVTGPRACPFCFVFRRNRVFPTHIFWVAQAAQFAAWVRSTKGLLTGFYTSKLPFSPATSRPSSRRRGAACRAREGAGVRCPTFACHSRVFLVHVVTGPRACPHFSPAIPWITEGRRLSRPRRGWVSQPVPIGNPVSCFPVSERGLFQPRNTLKNTEEKKFRDLRAFRG